MTPRSELILKLVVEDYIKSAEPVGSKYLIDTYGLPVSSATVRNEMALLEREGFLRAPHTSAGRVPTEAAYQYYLKHLQQKKFVIKGAPLKEAVDAQLENTLRGLAKRLVELSGETALVAKDPKWSYYTGVSNLFHKPEFRDLELVRSLGEMVDSFDELVEQLYGEVPDEPYVLIGKRSPFAEGVSAVMVTYRAGKEKGLLGIVGPMRMDYARNMALVGRAREVIEEQYG